MNVNYTPSDPAAAAPAIVCVSSGKLFPFAQTVEGRCLRDHALHAEREKVKNMAMMRSGSGNVTVTGPTITVSN